MYVSSFLFSPLHKSFAAATLPLPYPTNLPLRRSLLPSPFLFLPVEIVRSLSPANQHAVVIMFFYLSSRDTYIHTYITMQFVQ